MMKEEFEGLAGKPVTVEEYDKIETVYMFHPLINDVGGKNQIVNFWRLGVIADMYVRAQAIKELEDDERDCVSNITTLKRELDDQIATIREKYEKQIAAAVKDKEKVIREREQLQKL